MSSSPKDNEPYHSQKRSKIMANRVIFLMMGTTVVASCGFSEDDDSMVEAVVDLYWSIACTIKICI